jgi:hypothetical protein
MLPEVMHRTTAPASVVVRQARAVFNEETTLPAPNHDHDLALTLDVTQEQQQDTPLIFNCHRNATSRCLCL